MRTPLRIGVVGIGRAGTARVRAVKARSDAHLVGVHGGRAAAEAGVPVHGSVASLAEACDLLVVCSPSEHHPAHVSEGLRAGCHVLCEFPLARTAAAAAELFSEADRVGKRLLVEHIELLSPSTVFLARAMAGQRVLCGELSFSRSTVGAELTDHVARVQRLWALCGPLRLSSRTLRRTGAGQTVLAGFQGRDACTLQMVLREGPDLPRELKLSFTTEAADGRRHVFSLQGREIRVDGASVRVQGAAGGLFALDLDLAIQAVRESAPFYASAHRVVSVLRAITALRDGF